MNCTHEQLRCTDGVFYCLKCGAVVGEPPKAVESTTKEDKPVEAKKTGRKRKAETDK